MVRSPFNSLSRDHHTSLCPSPRNYTSFQLPLSGSPSGFEPSPDGSVLRGFQLPLSGSRNGYLLHEVQQTGLDCFQLPLSGSLVMAGISTLSIKSTGTFQLPLSGSPIGWRSGVMFSSFLSTPSLGITARMKVPAQRIPRDFQLPLSGSLFVIRL